MAQADSKNSTTAPVVSTRRGFLTLVGGATACSVAMTMTATAATGIDPVFGLIEAHRTAGALHSAALEEQARLEQMDVPGAWEVGEAPCHADARAFRELVNTAPQTFAGLQAWASYLDEVRGEEEWMLEDTGPTLVSTLVQALGNLAVAS